MKKTNFPDLPAYSKGIAAALLGAREAVMSPIRPILREQNLTEQQWRLLRVLIDHGPMEISKAADASLILAPSVTRIVKDLSKRHLVKRVVDSKDKRRSTLSVTARGRALVRKTAQQTTELLADYKKAFGAKRFNALVGELREFQQTTKKVDRSST